MGGGCLSQGQAAHKTLRPPLGDRLGAVGSSLVLPGEAGLQAGPALSSPPGHSGMAAPHGQVSEGWVGMA